MRVVGQVCTACQVRTICLIAAPSTVSVLEHRERYPQAVPPSDLSALLVCYVIKPSHASTLGETFEKDRPRPGIYGAYSRGREG